MVKEAAVAAQKERERVWKSDPLSAESRARRMNPIS